jgi:murein DD-endopeptidase MepM/ murein hydrolase activator NlpD
MTLILKTPHPWARLLLAASLLCLAGAASPRSVRAQTAGPTYIIEPGDTLFGIAQQFGLTVEALQAANPNVDAAALQVGQALVIPGFSDVTGRLRIHRVEPGESLSSIALGFGLTPETLIRLNRVVNPDRVYINQPLVLVEDGAPLETGMRITVSPNEGLLGLAAAHNRNPWTLAARSRIARPSALPPGGAVVVPGGETPLTALPPTIRALQLRPLPAVQGHTLSVRLVAGSPLTLTASLGEWPLVFNADPAQAGSYVALLGLDRLAEPNLYTLTLAATDTSGRTARFAQSLAVRAGDFGADPPLRVDPATIDPAVTEPESAQIKAIVAPVTPTRYWDGAFQRPSVGALRSLFGALRSYNGSPYDAFHGGVDFTGAEDRPITAPAPGRVVFAESLTVRGNATLIDHGWGVYTGYWHQSVIQVQVGQTVETGQIIGFQGATGRVTGPHLHWEVWVGGFQVDPLEWTETAFP